MTDKPTKRLSLKVKATAPSSEDVTNRPLRSRKHIIRREDLPADRLSGTKAPPKPKKKPKAATSKTPTTSPSDIRLDNLNTSLNAFEVWRDLQPLALGIEKQLFQHIAKHQLSCSKRVVQRLLREHTRKRSYLQPLVSGAVRFNLDGTESGTINQSEKNHAAQLISAIR